jgi:hypothetical protein
MKHIGDNKTERKSFPSWWWLLLLIGCVVIVLIVHYIWMQNGCSIVDKDTGTTTTDLLPFLGKYGGYIGLTYSTLIGIFPYVVQEYWNKRNEERRKILDQERQQLERKNGKYIWNLSLKHKEKVNILEKFGGSITYNYLGDDSIYGTMIDVLKRLKNESDDGIQLKELYVFLCSPVLDTPERVNGEYNKWGEEFSSILRDMTTEQSGLLKGHVNICFLSDEAILGFKPLRNFVEVLANYCAAFEKDKSKNSEVEIKSAGEINKIIYNKTKIVYDEILNKHKDTYSLTLLEDIPFQMIITNTDKFSEVVVSFAGKAIIEKENYDEPKGFHSIDPDVVKAFIDIFRAYANTTDRVPFKPQHTETIIKQTKNKHTIKKYHNNTLPDILSNSPLTIPANTFSPFYANSSKFTTDVLLYILRKNNKVIEIGSGSGIQVLAAHKKLLKLGTKKPTIWAIEPFADKLLADNCKSAVDISTKKWILRVKNGDNKDVHLIDKEKQAILCNRGKCGVPKCSDTCIKQFEFEITEKDFQGTKFDIVLGDLPFVSADTKNASDEELAYYDLHHSAHRALLRLFKNATWLNKEAKLITAFSTLGGYEDTSNFARMIQDEGLVVVQHFCYLENDFHWIVYCLMKKDEYDAANKDKKDYWKDRFGISLA